MGNFWLLQLLAASTFGYNAVQLTKQTFNGFAARLLYRQWTMDCLLYLVNFQKGPSFFHYIFPNTHSVLVWSVNSSLHIYCVFQTKICSIYLFTLANFLLVQYLMPHSSFIFHLKMCRFSLFSPFPDHHLRKFWIVLTLLLNKIGIHSDTKSVSRLKKHSEGTCFGIVPILFNTIQSRSRRWLTEGMRFIIQTVVSY